MSEPNRGTKRKRYEPPKEKDLGAKIVGKLHHELKEVKKATKKSKTFETQKLVKRLKSLRLKDEASKEITDCETQLEELKSINHDAVATTALRTKITKDKLLASNEHVKSAISKELDVDLLMSAEPGTPAAKVQSRLLSSKLVAYSINTIIGDLRSTLNLGPDEPDATGSRPVKLKKTIDGARKPLRVDVLKSQDRNVINAPSGSIEEEVESESGTIGDDEKEEEDGLGWESGSVDDTGAESDTSDHSIASAVESDHSPPSKTRKVEKPTAKPSTAGGSTFLPSLSVGFVGGGSDASDWSGEDDAKAAEPRKNRRGQRARQAIWEKKYGKNANHKKKEAANPPKDVSQERGRKRWPDKTHDRGTQRHGRGKDPVDRHQPPKSDVGWAGRSKPANPPRTQPPKVPDDGKPLHPSWEAKRRMKETQSAAIQPTTGKKIVF